MSLPKGWKLHPTTSPVPANSSVCSDANPKSEAESSAFETWIVFLVILGPISAWFDTNYELPWYTLRYAAAACGRDLKVMI